ncbi:MAG: radical SAM protein [Proteobacteria bacterium]|nr:radical SAM protein [Pseudomonadota bacterium]
MVGDENKSLKILLITPKGRKELKSSVRPSFAVAIGALVSITPRRHHVELVDELFGDEIDYNGNYDLVGVTVRTVAASRAYEIGDRFLKARTKVVFGGVHPKFKLDEAMAHCSSVVCGEAENLWEAVLRDVEQGDLKPIYEAADFPPVKTIPALDYERIFASSKREKVGSHRFIPIYATRGCPYSCSFCVTPRFSGRLYRTQSPELLKQQIEQARRFWFKGSRFRDKPLFMFTDENFAVNKKKTRELLEAIKECNIRFSILVSLNFLEDMNIVRLLVEAGCAMAGVGFESIQKEAIENYGKKHQNKVERFTSVVTQCQEAGLSIQGSFIIDPTRDTYQDIKALETFVRVNHITMPVLNLLTPYPGTETYDEYDKNGLIVDYDWDKYSAFSLVIKTANCDPDEYQIKYLKSYINMYSWRSILSRMWHNHGDHMELVTGIIWRRNLRDRLRAAIKGTQPQATLVAERSSGLPKETN